MPAASAIDSPEPVSGVLVAIGASAGCVGALAGFFGAVPARTGIAYVVIVHLSPGGPSLLPQILERQAGLPAVEVVDGMEPIPDRIHVIPPGAGMTLVNGRLRLDGEHWRGRPVRPIDEFFRSLAAERGSRAVAILLSGTGSDGSAGIVAVHRAGGFTLAQDEETAEYREMPRSAIATGAVDQVLAPAACPAAILAHFAGPHG